MSLFFSPSSIGYVFGTIVVWVSAWKLYKSYKRSHIEVSRLFIVALIYLGITMLFYGAPPFFFHDKPEILGWFNVLANLSLGIWLAYTVKLIFLFNPSKINANIPFYIFLFWAVFILVPVNIIYLPLPTFDSHGLEIWNYEWPLFLNTGLISLFISWFLSGTIVYRLPEVAEGHVALSIAIAYSFGGLAACLITAAHTTGLALIGYLLLFIGGFVASLFAHLGSNRI